MSKESELKLINFFQSWIDKAEQRQQYIKGIALGLFMESLGTLLFLIIMD